VTSCDLSVRDGIVLVPLVLAILAFGLYPQAALSDGEGGVRAAVRSAQAVSEGKENPVTAARPPEAIP
jgi:NADH:ubiquinone oxidoreductase subunit 4 (subunit M)